MTSTPPLSLGTEATAMPTPTQPPSIAKETVEAAIVALQSLSHDLGHGHRFHDDARGIKLGTILAGQIDTLLAALEAAEAREAALVEGLTNLDVLFDFDDPPQNNEAYSFDDASLVAQRFTEARALLSTPNAAPVQEDRSHGPENRSVNADAEAAVTGLTALADTLEQTYGVGKQEIAIWLRLVLADVARYRTLRNADPSNPRNGGIFIGCTPSNVILTEEDADHVIDEFMRDGLQGLGRNLMTLNAAPVPPLPATKEEC